MILLAIGVALDGGALAEAAEVPALMAAWAVAVVLIDRWVCQTALRLESPFWDELGDQWGKGYDDVP